MLKINDVVYNKKHMEWGNFRVIAVKPYGYEIQSTRGVRVLFANEILRWKKVKN